MSDRYPFPGDTTFTHNGPMVWNDQVPVQSTLDFSHESDSTLTDSINESYATAVEDNETQYLSVLETTNDITLEDIHSLTLENSKMALQENLQFGNINPLENLDVNGDETNDQQVIVFSMDGSDDLYGIQFAQDEDGNMQKYQFKFRTTEDGQLEAIPESIQLLINDIDVPEKDEEGETVIQEDIAGEGQDVTDTQIVYQEDSGIQATTIFQKSEDVSTKDYNCHSVQEDQCNNVQMFIKGELEMLDHRNDDDATQIFINEPLSEDKVMEDQEVEYGENVIEEDFEQNFGDDEDNVDVKMGILEESSVSTNIKQEIFQEESQDVDGLHPPEAAKYEIYNQHHVDIKSLPYQNGSKKVVTEQDVEHHLESNVGLNNGYIEVGEGHETVLEYERYSPEMIRHVCEETELDDTQNLQEVPPHNNTHYEQVFIKEDTFHRLSEVKQSQVFQSEKHNQEAYYTETGAENDSDNDDYQIVEGLHVTGDIDQDSSCTPYEDSDNIHAEIPKKASIVEHANILKQPSLMRATKESKIKNKTFVYYVVPHVEKENVNSLSVNYASSRMSTYRPIKSNPRSILKSSFPETREKPEVKALMDERFNKRFARSKEAVQARLFNNFISKTTIPHAPVRQTRLPRKQQIKPVDNRRDEEIIVQEVMVGSNGFIENLEEKLRNRDKLEITQYVILSDSDDEYDPKKDIKRRKKCRKSKKSDMTDSEDSDTSIIEIQSDEDVCSDPHENIKRARGRPKKCTDFKDLMDGMKRRRGRPPKSNISTEEIVQKNNCMKSDEIETDITKKEFKCPHCTKTFPSQNSLSTHIHHHSLEDSLRNREKNISTVQYRHKCVTCQESFKNSFLLNRHVCSKDEGKTSKKVTCAICKKSCSDLTTLNVHKRLHIKENLVSTTTLTKVSPKKIISRPSTSKTLTFKCKECSRICFSQDSLKLHERTHKKFGCNSCGASFPSRLLLDTHIRVNCVKSSPLTKNKRLSFKIRKSYVQSPQQKSHNVSKRVMSNSFTKTVSKNPLGLKLQCEQCQEKFTMFQELFKHQVKEHGLETPDKSVLLEQKKQLHKPKPVHGGIPARDGMRKVFQDIRSKIALMTPKKNSR